MIILNHPAESNPLEKRDYKSIHVDTEVIEGNGSVGSIFESPADDNACDGYDEKTSNQRRKQGVKVLLFAASAICMTIIGISNLHPGSNLINPPQRDLDGGFFFGTWSTTDGNSEDSADTNRKDESKSGDGGDDSESETPFVPPNVPDESDPDEMARFVKEINSRSGIPDYVPIWRDDCCDNRMFLVEGKKCQDACVSLCPDPSRRTAPVCYSDCNAKCGRHASQFICGTGMGRWANAPNCPRIEKVKRPDWCSYYWDVGGQYGECCDSDHIFDCDSCQLDGCKVHS